MPVVQRTQSVDCDMGSLCVLFGWCLGVHRGPSVTSLKCSWQSSSRTYWIRLRPLGQVLWGHRSMADQR